MSKRPEITRMLSQATEKYITPNNDPRIYWAREVTFDNGTSGECRVDYMKFFPLNNTVSGIEKGDFFCYEIVSSVEDFRSQYGHNFIGDYNYYVMTEDVYGKVMDEIPWNIGVLVPDGIHLLGEWYKLRSVQNAVQKNRTRTVAEMLLMMFRSCAREKRKNFSHGGKAPPIHHGK